MSPSMERGNYRRCRRICSQKFSCASPHTPQTYFGTPMKHINKTFPSAIELDDKNQPRRGKHICKDMASKEALASCLGYAQASLHFTPILVG